MGGFNSEQHYRVHIHDADAQLLDLACRRHKEPLSPQQQQLQNVSLDDQSSSILHYRSKYDFTMIDTARNDPHHPHSPPHHPSSAIVKIEVFEKSKSLIMRLITSYINLFTLM